MSVYGLPLYYMAQRDTKEQKSNEDMREFCFLVTPRLLFQLRLRGVMDPCVGGTGALEDAQGQVPFRRFPWCNSGTSSHWPKFERVEKVIFADAMVWDLVGSGFLPLGAHLAKQKYWGNLFLLNWKCIWAMFPKLAVHQNPCGDLLKICIPGLLPDLQSDSEPSKYQNPTFSKAVSVSPMQPIFACAGGKLNSNSYYSYVVWL